MGEGGLEVQTVSCSLSGVGEGSLLGGRGPLWAFAFRVALVLLSGGFGLCGQHMLFVFPPNTLFLAIPSLPRQ